MAPQTCVCHREKVLAGSADFLNAEHDGRWEWPLTEVEWHTTLSGSLSQAWDVWHRVAEAHLVRIGILVPQNILPGGSHKGPHQSVRERQAAEGG